MSGDCIHRLLGHLQRGCIRLWLVYDVAKVISGLDVREVEQTDGITRGYYTVSAQPQSITISLVCVIYGISVYTRD